MRVLPRTVHLFSMHSVYPWSTVESCTRCMLLLQSYYYSLMWDSTRNYLSWELSTNIVNKKSVRSSGKWTRGGGGEGAGLLCAYVEFRIWSARFLRNLLIENQFPFSAFSCYRSLKLLSAFTGYLPLQLLSAFSGYLSLQLLSAFSGYLHLQLLSAFSGYLPLQLLSAFSGYLP